MRARIEHGGALDQAVSRYGGIARNWLDLSTGINPEAFALPQMDLEIWNRLPDSKLQAETLSAARRYYDVDYDAPLVAASGTQALIQIIPTLMRPSTVAILSPTYQEHAASFHLSGWKVHECAKLADVPAEALVVVIVNPNNPDGRVVDQGSLLALAQRLDQRGGFLVVDEAFADPHPGVSIATHAADAPIIVLKSFGKFFGLAGVRLGFMFASQRLVEKVEEKLGPWAVSGPALAIARHAFNSAEELKEFRARLQQRRLGLSDVLQRSQLIEIGGTDLFALVSHPDADAVYDELCKKHILVRKFSYAPEWLRIGLALDDAGLGKLETALQIIS